MDKLDGTDLATVEIFREIQMIEEKYAERLTTVDPFAEDGQYFTKTSTGHGSVRVCPELRERIAEQMRTDSAILKEKRKAREERQLLRAPPQPKGGGEKKKWRAGEDAPLPAVVAAAAFVRVLPCRRSASC